MLYGEYADPSPDFTIDGIFISFTANTARAILINSGAIVGVIKEKLFPNNSGASLLGKYFSTNATLPSRVFAFDKPVCS